MSKSMLDKTLYFLFIDGHLSGGYDNIDKAKKECWGGDNFRIYKAKCIYEEIRNDDTDNDVKEVKS